MKKTYLGPKQHIWCHLDPFVGVIVIVVVVVVVVVIVVGCNTGHTMGFFSHTTPVTTPYPPVQ